MKIVVALLGLVLAVSFLGCGPQPYTEWECSYRDYDAKAQYVSRGTGHEWDWNIYYPLGRTDYYSLDYYITNYEDQSGVFAIQLRYVYMTPGGGFGFLESYIVDRIQIGPHETEYGSLDYEYIRDNKPWAADHLQLRLIIPQFEECEWVTKYR